MASHNLGMVQLSQEQYATAATTLTDALQRMTLARGPDHPETVFCEVHLLVARSKAEGPLAVDADYATAMERFVTTIPENHPLFRESLIDHGRHLLDLSQACDRLAKEAPDQVARERHVDEVIDALERALQVFRRAGNAGWQRRALSWLAEASGAYGRAEAAARWASELQEAEPRRGR
jgi:hypothetical protein